jgi:hypothetical protein
MDGWTPQTGSGKKVNASIQLDPVRNVDFWPAQRGLFEIRCRRHRRTCRVGSRCGDGQDDARDREHERGEPPGERGLQAGLRFEDGLSRSQLVQGRLLELSSRPAGLARRAQLSKIFPGLRMPFGSSARLTALSMAISSGERE